MFMKRSPVEKVTEMGCCGCFGFSFLRKSPRQRPNGGFCNNTSHERLLSRDVDGELPEELDEEIEDDDEVGADNGYVIDTGDEDVGEVQSPLQRAEEIIKNRAQNGFFCREVPVKETDKLIRSEDENGNKMINEYVREYKIGSGSYAKVVLYRSSLDGKHYAIKAFHKSHLLKIRVAPGETAMSDVLREVMIMKMVSHPNIVNLVEVIDDPTTDHFYMVLEFVDGKCVCKDGGPPGGLGNDTSRKYMRDIVSGLMYLHEHKIVHGDIKPDNLLVTASATLKIGDFGVSQVFEDEDDKLRRSPGTPVFTAPECCLGLPYGGRASDTWAVGVTLYCLIFGDYPFLAENLHDTYVKIVNNPLHLPDNLDPLLKDLIEGLLCKDPSQRMTLEAVTEHPWVIAEESPIPQYLCWCKRNGSRREACEHSGLDTLL